MLGPQSLNTSTAYPLTLRGRNRRTMAGRFTGAEVIVATLWAGDDQANAATVSAAWDTSIAGNPSTTAEATLLLTVSSSAIAALVPGIYTYQIIADPSSAKLELARGQIQLVAGPGSATAIKVYCTAEDLRRACPWIDDLHHPGQQTGFAEERGQSREWYDQLVNWASPAPADLAPYEPGYVLGPTRSTRRNLWLQAQLDADRLMLRPEVVRANVFYALWLILQSQVGTRDKTSYQSLAAGYYQEAESLAAMTTVELDTDADGVGDWAAFLGRIKRIRG